MLTTFSTNRTVNKVDFLPHLGTPGTWGIGPFKLPDFGITEAFGSSQPGGGGGSTFQNQAIPYASPPAVLGANTQTSGGGGGSSWGGSPTPVTSTPTAPSSGGGGGSNNVSSVGYNPTHEGQTVEINGNTYRSNANGGWDLVSGAGTDETNRLIDEAYGASSNYLNQAEQMLRGDYPTVLSEIETQRANAQKLAESGKTSTLGSIGEQQTLATQRNQNVMADARRLYDELRRGYGQRFGGASSAGQAATELGNLEQQRQTGRTQQDFGNTLRQIEQARTQVETKFQEQIMQLEQTKQSAVNEANRDFQSKLLQIQQSRAENEQAKAQARLSALQDLRNKVYQINLQNLQFQQTLQAQKQQAELGLKSYTDDLNIFDNQAETAGQGYNPSISSNLQTSSVQGASTTNPYLGAITQQPNRKDDFLSGLGFSLYQ